MTALLIDVRAKLHILGMAVSMPSINRPAVAKLPMPQNCGN